VTAFRSLAVKISGAVVRWASPGSREWAEGLEREIAFIEEDWRALGWAIGSMRVVLDRRGAHGEVSRPSLWYLWPIAEVLQVFANSISVCKASNWHDRIAAGLLAFGWASWSVFTIADLLREQNEPPISDIQAYQLFSRTKLERRLERYRSPRRWLPLLVPVSLCVGYVMTLEGVGLGYVANGLVIVAAVLAIFMLCLDTPAKIEARLLRLNERIAASASASGR
jgi:hypothetical protein